MFFKIAAGGDLQILTQRGKWVLKERTKSTFKLKAQPPIQRNQQETDLT